MEGPDRELAALHRRVDRVSDRLASVDKWHQRTAARVSALAAEVERLDRADEIARKVAERVNAGRTGLHLAWWQKLGGAVAGALIVIDAVRGLIP